MPQETDSIWFAGDAVEAVTEATKKCFVFIACITEKNELEGNVLTIFEDSEIRELLFSNCVSVKLVRSEPDEEMFSQIFPSNDTPCIHIVGPGPVKSLLSGDNITKKGVIDAIEKGIASKPATSVPPIGPAAPATSEISDESNTPIPTSSRALKATKASTNDDGQNIHNTRKQAEQTRKNIIKSKIDDNRRRKEILEQMREDRRELNLRRRNNADKANQHNLTENSEPHEPKVRQTGKARILFRVSNGATTSHEFDDDAVFAEVQMFISDFVSLPEKRIQISQIFPKRHLGSDVSQKKLKELDLSPSATLLVNIGSNGTLLSSSSNNSWGAWFSNIYGIILSFFAYLFSWIPSFSSRTNTRHDNDTSPSSEAVSGHSTSRLLNQQNKDGALSQRKPSGSATEKNDSDDPDKRTSTYNGNSTNLE